VKGGVGAVRKSIEGGGEAKALADAAPAPIELTGEA
jgi:hypothetical protein